MLRLPRLHLTVGLVTLAAFIGTGVFIKINIEEIIEQGDAVRYQYRANHVLIVMAGLIHLLLWKVNQAPGSWQLGCRIGSIGALIAAPLLIAAFFIEPPKGIAERPITASGVIIMAISVVLTVLPSRRNKNKKNLPPQ